MAKFTAVEIRDMLKDGSLTVADLEYKDVIGAADDFRKQQDMQSFGTLYGGMIEEVSRLTTPASKTDNTLQVFNDSQLNQMPDMIGYLEKIAVKGKQQDFSSEKQALEARVKQRLQDIKDGKETEISPLSIDDLRAMAARAGIDISAELDAALAKYAQEQDIANISKEQLEANQTVLADMASQLDFSNDQALALTQNISANLDVASNPEEPNAKAEKDQELFREAAVNSAFAQLLTSDSFTAKVEAYNQEKDATNKAKLKAELEALFKAEINAQAEASAYSILFMDAVSEAEKQKNGALTQEESNQLSEQVNQNMVKLSKGEKVSASFNAFMGILADKSAAWDERVAYLSKKFVNSVVPNQLQARFSAWNQKMEQNHPKSWKFVKMAAMALKKAAPALALSGAVLLSAGTAMTVPAAVAYGAYRIGRGFKPLLKKFKEARQKDPNAGFVDTLKKNKIMTGRAILSVVSGGLGVVLSGGSVALDVASSARIGLAAGGATLSTAAAVDAWTDKKASKGRKWTETAMAAVSGALAAWGITKAVSADDVAASASDSTAAPTPNPVDNTNETTAPVIEETETQTETPTQSQTPADNGAEETWVEQEEVMKKLKAYNSSHGMNNSSQYSWWSTRTAEDLENQYNNLSDDVMEKYFKGMSREEVLMKYNRLDAWTARVKILPNGDMVPLKDAPRYHANDELAILKKIIECGEHPKAEDVKAAVDYMDAHITSKGNTDLPGIRTGNRIDTIKNPGCAEENEAYGKGHHAPKGEPKTEPKTQPEPEHRPTPTPISIPTPNTIPTQISTPNSITLPDVVIEEVPFQPLDNVLVHQGDYGTSYHFAGEVTEVAPQFDARGHITNVDEVFNTKGADSQTMWLVKNEVTGKMDAYMLQDGKTPTVAYSDEPRYFGKVAGVEYKKDLFRKDHQAIWVDENGNTHRSGVNSKSKAFSDYFNSLNEKNLVGDKGKSINIQRNIQYIQNRNR